MIFQKGATLDPSEFSGINDEEIMAAVLEMSRQEAGLSAPPPLEDRSTSSPDTGFGDSEVQVLDSHTDLLETERQPAGNTNIRSVKDLSRGKFVLLFMLWFCVDVLDSLDLTMDENKENQTPEGVQQQGELDWVQQYNLDQEREEQELQQALAQSLQEHVRIICSAAF